MAVLNTQMGGLEGIGNLNSLKYNPLLNKSALEEQRKSSVIIPSSTPKTDALSAENMTFMPKTGGVVNTLAKTGTLIDRSIEDLQKKIGPKENVINMNRGFGGIVGINRPTIGSQFAQPDIAKDTMLQNFAPETQEAIRNEVQENIAYDKVMKNIDIDASLEDLTVDMKNVISEGRTPDIAKLKELYPEFSRVDDNVLQDLTDDIGNVVKEGRDIDMNKLKELYPELSSLDVTNLGDVQYKTPQAQVYQGIAKGVSGLFKGLFKEGLYEGGKDFLEDAKQTRNDTNTNLGMGDKIAKIIIGDFMMNYVGGRVIGDTFAGALGGIIEGVTTDSQRKYMLQQSSKVLKNMIDVAKTNADISDIKTIYDNLKPEEQQGLNDIFEASLNSLNYIGAGELAKPVVMGFKEGKILINDIIKGAKENLAKKTISAIEKEAIVNAKAGLADKMIDNMHKFTIPEIRNFETKFGETPGQYLNNKGLIANGEDTLLTSMDDMAKAKLEKQQGLANISETVPVDDDVIKMAQEVADYKRNVSTPEELKISNGVTKYDDLVTKAKNGKLTQTELEDIKSTFEREKALKYDATRPSEEQSRLINLDSSIRTKQQQRAEQGGFNNIGEINKEISKNKTIIDMLSKDVDKISGLGLSDYVLLATSKLDSISLSVLVGKKIAKTDWFKKNIVKLINKVNGKTNVVEKIADLNKIKSISNETDFNNFLKEGELKNPALPKAREGAVNPEGINYTTDVNKPITVTPQGQAVRQGQILEIPKKEASLSNLQSKVEENPIYNLGKTTKKQSKTIGKIEDKSLKNNVKNNEVVIYRVADKDYPISDKNFMVGKKKGGLSTYLFENETDAKNLLVSDKIGKYKITKYKINTKDYIEMKRTDYVAKVKEMFGDTSNVSMDKYNELIKKEGYKGIKMIVDNNKNKIEYIDFDGNKLNIVNNKQGLSNLGKTMNESIPQNKVVVKAPEESLIAEARKYKSAEEFIESKLQKQEYRSAHQLKLGDSITADNIDVVKLKEQIRNRRGYLSNDTIKGLKKLEQLQGNPNKEITIYRASPKEGLNDGDWVTIDKDYANDIKKQNGGKVYSYTAKVGDLRFPTDVETLPSLAMESTFSYSPETTKLKQIREEANKGLSKKKLNLQNKVKENPISNIKLEEVNKKGLSNLGKIESKGLKPKSEGLNPTNKAFIEHKTPSNISKSELYKYEEGNYRPISYDKALEFGGEDVIVDKGQAYLRMKGGIKINETKINKLAEELEKRILVDGKRMYIDAIQSNTKLGDILDYPILYNEYPQLKNLTVGFSKNNGYKGAFNGKSIDVSIIDGVNHSEIKQTLLHEIQHWIQQEYGLQGGGNIAMIRDMDNWNNVYDELLGQTKKIKDMGNKTFKGEPVPVELIKEFETKIKEAKALFNKEMTTKDLMDMKREGIDYMDKIRGDFEEIVGGTDIIRNYRKIPGEQGARLAGGDEPLFMGDIEAAFGRKSKGGLQPKQGSVDVKGDGKGLDNLSITMNEKITQPKVTIKTTNNNEIILYRAPVSELEGIKLGKKNTGMYTTSLEQYANSYKGLDKNIQNKMYKLSSDAKIYKAEDVEALYKKLFGKQISGGKGTHSDWINNLRTAESDIKDKLLSQGYDVIEYENDYYDMGFAERFGIEPPATVILNDKVITEIPYKQSTIKFKELSDNDKYIVRKYQNSKEDLEYAKLRIEQMKQKGYNSERELEINNKRLKNAEDEYNKYKKQFNDISNKQK